MILTFDISNASTVMGFVDEGRSVARYTLSSSTARTADEYTITMELLASRDCIDISAVTGAVIASVVPHLTSVVAEAVRRSTGKSPLIIGPGVKTGLNIRMDDPSELGGDLVASAVGATAVYSFPCVIVDLSTATTISVLDSRGCYVGGVICAGVMMSQVSLAKGASQLPNVSLEAPPRIIGKNTVECMQSGLVFGPAAMLDGMIARIEAELGEPVTVVATGDWAKSIIPHCTRQGIVIDEELIMRGLWNIYKKNREK